MEILLLIYYGLMHKNVFISDVIGIASYECDMVSGDSFSLNRMYNFRYTNFSFCKGKSVIYSALSMFMYL